MIGDRIKLARLAAPLSLQELADSLEDNGYKITRAALSKYETGKIPPNEPFLSAVAKLLGLDKCVFQSDMWPEVNIKLFGELDLIPKQTSELMAHLQLKLEQHLHLDEILNIPKREFVPQIISPARDQFQTEIDSLTEYVREQWGNKNQVIASVCGMLESNGWYVFEIPSLFGVNSVSGIETNSGKPFLAFTYAPTVDDTRFNILKEAALAFIRCEDKELLEEMCCCFSRAMLLPKSEIMNEYSDLQEEPDRWALFLLKQRYGISRIQIKERMQELGIYTAEGPKKTMKNIRYIQSRKLQDSKSDLLCFFENPINFKVRVREAKRRGLITQAYASSVVNIRYI